MITRVLRQFGLAVVLMLAACSASQPAAEQGGSEPDAPAPLTQAEDVTHVPLEAVIAFSDPQYCEMAASFVELLDGLAPTDDATGRLATPYNPQTPVIEGVRFGTPSLSGDDQTHQVDVDVSGLWHGLTLTGISRFWAEESDWAGFSLRFSNPPDEVIAALNGQGFALPPSGSRETDSELPFNLAVRAEGAGAKFSCSS